MKRALSLFVPFLILFGSLIMLAQAPSASAVPICPQATAHITGCGCGVFPVHPIGPIRTIACVII
jgi:hypothetical protein